MRLIFAGSPEIAIPSLNALSTAGHEIALVITREDSPFGRKGILTPTPVGKVANDLNLPTLKANRISDHRTRIEAANADLGVIVAYGGLIPRDLLVVPKFGWINLHFSLLPRWRGAAPVQHAILNGDEITGACVFQLVEKLDAGPIFGSVTQPIGRNETAGHLLSALSNSGSSLLVKVVEAISNGAAKAVEQQGDVTLAPKFLAEDARIDWRHSAARIDKQIRACTPEPGAFTTIAGSRLKILEAQIDRDGPRLSPGEIRGPKEVMIGTGTDPVALKLVQPSSKSPMKAADWLRGHTGEMKADINRLNE
ncbi:MAG: methionyl-tRNA formyltransferase [Microbacteriaceae bacterium]|nr:methionyl-tRNA formyltransferase [Microbacteriaceae bacterium]